MSNDVLVLAEHQGGALCTVTFELAGRARELADAWGGQVQVALLGASNLAGQLGSADVVFTAEHPALADYNPEAYERVLLSIVHARTPRLVLLSTATAGLDLSAALSVGWDAPVVSSVVGLSAEGEGALATAQIYGGKLLAEVELAGSRAVCAVIAGSFPAAAGRRDRPPAVEAIDAAAVLDGLRTSVTGVVTAEAGDVDITAADVLVSVGRGIGSRDDLEVAEELADALGAPLAGSRPLTDQGWLPKSRQVGKSGVTVKPKLYLALGISGAPEHVEGMRDAELVIACNTDAKAPIFDVAHYGTTVDLFDLVPELVKRLKP
ncbi:MAG TPA: electron transfer flavoprotein subunit alpha/FixB family protein [Candidatus Binatia bacterium]|nr:electron transfer flavoprotein subunit alpha/FixB family protein [Candidatus Binatia bacterium]